MSGAGEVADGRCPKCGGDVGVGYGLMGGGCGAYWYCETDGCDYFRKEQDPPDDEEPQP